jgi:hypothetical protein
VAAPKASRKLGLKFLIALNPAPNWACTAGQEDDAVLLGLMVLAAKALCGPDGIRHRDRFRDAGDLAFQEDANRRQSTP